MAIALHASPRLACDDVANSALVDAEHGGDVGLTGGCAANGSDIGSGQLGSIVRFAARRIVSFAVGSIGSVLFGTAKPQVGRVTADAIVAAMKHKDIRRGDWLAIGDSPCHAMRLVGAARDLETAVAITATGWPAPWMAGVSATAGVNPIGKPSQSLSRATPIAARRGAAQFGWLTGRNVKGGTAMCALPSCENGSSHVTSLGSVVRSAVRIPVLPRFAYFSRFEVSPWV